MSAIAAALAMKAGEKLIDKAFQGGKKKKVKRAFRKGKQFVPSKGKGKTTGGPRSGRGVAQSLRAPASIATRLSFQAPKQRAMLIKDRIAIRVTGREYFGNISASALAPGAYIPLFQIALNPYFWSGSRVQTMSNTWQKFYFNKVILHYVPICGSSTSGACIFGGYQDPDFNTGQFTGTLSYAQSLMATSQSVMVNYWETLRFEFKDSTPKEYYINPELTQTADDRLSVQGEIIQLDAGSSSGNGANQLGVVWMEYDISFFEPALTQYTWKTAIVMVYETGGFSSKTEWSVNPSVTFGTSSAQNLAIIPTVTRSYLTAGTVYYVGIAGSSIAFFQLYYDPNFTDPVPGNFTLNSYNMTFLWQLTSAVTPPTRPQGMPLLHRQHHQAMQNLHKEDPVGDIDQDVRQEPSSSRPLNQLDEDDLVSRMSKLDALDKAALDDWVSMRSGPSTPKVR
jgi:hypothetical protein